VEQGRRGGNDDTLSAESLDGLLDLLDGILEVGLPDVTSINNTDGEDLVGAEGLDDLLELLGSTDKVDMNSGSALGENVQVVDDVAKVGRQGELGDVLSESSKLLVGGTESILSLLGEVKNQDRLVDLDSLGTSLGQLGQKLLIDGQEGVEEGDGVHRGTTVRLSEVEERDGSEDDRASNDTLGLGLKEVADGLGVGRQGESLAILESGANIVVVAVEPLYHLLCTEKSDQYSVPDRASRR